MNCW
jgi:hypothetical protein